MTDKKEESKTKENEANLDDLLDSALKDFQKVDGEEKQVKKDEATGEEDDLWNEEFFTEQAKLLNERMNAIFSASGGTDNETPSTDQITVGFQKMAEAAAIALQSNVSVDDTSTKYTESITEALKGLKEGVDDLQAPVSETDIANMFTGLNLQEGENSDSNPFLPFMHGMMRSLLSAEILLPSIKELLEKYPKYLEENSNNINAADKERYMKQQELFKVICDDLESEKSDDSSDVKQQRFKRVLDNMQKLHEYGQPPEDLIGDVGAELPNFGMGAQGNNQQCPLM